MNITNTAQSFSTRCSLFVLILLMGANVLHAGLEQQVPSTATNTIGAQFLAPYRKELKKFDTAIQSIEESLKANPSAAAGSEQQLTALYQAHYGLVHFIADHEILFTRFALNELVKQESFTPLVDFNDYEHNLYVACSPLDKEKDSYKENEHLLHHLAKHTHLKSGYVKWAKVLGMPTTDIGQLRRTQAVSNELWHNKDLLKELESHLQAIKDQGLEDSFLSFWKEDATSQVTSNAPYATNSNFSPIIEAAYAVIRARNGNATWLQETIKKLDQTTPFISTINWTTFIQDTSMIMLGVGTLKNAGTELVSAAAAIPQNLSYLGGWKLLFMPVALLAIHMLTNKIIDLSVKKRMQQEYEKFITLCEQNHQEKPQQSTITTGKIELVYTNAEQALTAQTLVTKHTPYCQAVIEKNNLIITLTAQEERSLRFSHPLMQHRTIKTIVLPCVLYLLTCYCSFGLPQWFGGTPAFVTEPLFQVPFTSDPKYLIKCPMPTFALLPWHAIKVLTCIGLLPAYAYQHFIKTPQKSIRSTTQSIQLARKTLLDFAQLINHVKQIQKLLVDNPVLRDNLREIEELDAEKVVQQKIASAQIILKQDDAFLQRSGLSKGSLNKMITYFEATHQELAKLLDILQTHANETEDFEAHNWLSPKGFVQNLKIRFGSDDLLAAYKIMQSIKDSFAPWIEALGEIDRKVSEARLLTEFEHKNVTFCFAEYEQQTTPHVAATGLWLPHLLSKAKPETIVTNDIEMGKDGQAATIILSGPTEGGKSTIERAVAIAALMAHTTGFVAATRWVATPLDRVLLSFNAADNLGKTVTKTASTDTQTGTSGFRDEVESIKRIVQEKEKLGKDKHMLIIIDELFQKVQRSGEYFSYHVIGQNFVTNNNTLSLIVSHREQPKYLEKETNGRCKNYHFVLKTVGDKLVNTYRIEPGALFRPEHKAVTMHEIISNQEDAYNLQITQEAGILGTRPTTIPPMVPATA